MKHSDWNLTVHVLVLPSWYPKTRADISGCFFREQALALRQIGCEVGVLAPLYRSLRRVTNLLLSEPVPPFENDDGIPTIRVPILNLFPRLVRLGAWNTIRQLIPHFDDYVRRFGRPDIVHLHSILPAGEFAVWLKECHGIPFVVTEHSSAYVRGSISARRLQRAQVIASKAQKRIAVSSTFAALLTRTLGSSSGPWECVPNMVAPYFCDAMPQKRNARTGTFVLLSIGSLERNKRFDLILAAFERVVRDHPHARIRLGGDGPERLHLQTLARQLGIADRVAFLGRLSRDGVLAEMLNADVFVLGSDSETFGVVLIEALACGVPIIATRCGGPEDIVRDSNGMLVPTSDIAGLHESMRHMITHRSDYDRDTIRAECEAQYGVRAVTSRLLSIYQAATAGSDPDDLRDRWIVG